MSGSCVLNCVCVCVCVCVVCSRVYELVCGYVCQMVMCIRLVYMRYLCRLLSNNFHIIIGVCVFR